MSKGKYLTGAGLVALAMVASLGAGSVALADPAAYAVTGTTCNFNKYLVMDAGDTVPNASFSFTVAPGTGRAASGSTYAVLPGVGTPTIADVTFSPADATATSAGTNIDVARTASSRGTGLTAATGVQLEDGEKYATKQATVDFSGVTFTEPGMTTMPTASWTSTSSTPTEPCRWEDMSCIRMTETSPQEPRPPQTRPTVSRTSAPPKTSECPRQLPETKARMTSTSKSP